MALGRALGWEPVSYTIPDRRCPAGPMQISLRHTCDPGDGVALAALLAELGWGERGDVDAAEALLRGATWFALAEVDGQLVGYVRALSDRTVVTYLAELGVAAAHRRQGIGSHLLAAAVSAFGHTTIYADAAPDVLRLLARHGIRARSEHLIACARKAAS